MMQNGIYLPIQKSPKIENAPLGKTLYKTRDIKTFTVYLAQSSLIKKTARFTKGWLSAKYLVGSEETLD